MKLDGFKGVEVEPYVNPTGVHGWRGRFATYAISLLDELDRGDLSRPQARAATNALRHAGLLAAIYFRADILPFVCVGLPVIDTTADDDRGVVTMINRKPGEEALVVLFNSGATGSFHPRIVGDFLKDGRWRLP